MRNYPGWLTAALLAAVAPSAPAQTVRTGHQVDPVFGALDARRPDFSNPATRRLEILADIWGNVALFHPVPSAAGLHWDDVLASAVRDLGGVRSEREFADLLNRVVFAPLGDPLAYATTIADQRTRLTLPLALSTRRFGNAGLYLSAADRVFANGEYAPRIRAALDSATGGGDIELLIVDLRSSRPGVFREDPAGWLGMWLEHPVLEGQPVSLFRETASGDPGDVKWLVSPRAALTPIAPRIRTPTVFLVNRTSYPAAEAALDAVRSSRKDVAVVFEETGPIPNLDYNAWQTWYPDSLLLPHFRTPLISADGALGAVVDVRTSVPVTFENIETVVAQALAVRAAERARSPFLFPDARVVDDTLLPGPLTREQRIAGLLKVWFWVGHFYAYLDDADGDWRHLVSDLLPRVEAARDDLAWYHVMEEISFRLNDSHSWVEHPLVPWDGYYPLRGQAFYVPPLYLEQIGQRVAVVHVDTSEAAVGIVPGDEVLMVDGQPVRQFQAAGSATRSVSKPGHQLPIRRLVVGPKDAPITLRIRGVRGVHDVTLPRSRRYGVTYREAFPGRKAWEILPGNLGYVNAVLIESRELFDSAMKAIAKTRGVLIDYRSQFAVGGDFDPYPFLTRTMPFLPWVDAITYLDGNSHVPMRALAVSQSWDVPALMPDSTKYTGQVVVMTSGYNTSAGESVAIWLRNHRRAVLVGTATNGTYGSKQTITLPGGAKFGFTVNRALSLDGSKYHGVGVVPDVPVEPTFAGLRAHRDEVYEKGVQTLRGLVGRGKP